MKEIMSMRVKITLPTRMNLEWRFQLPQAQNNSHPKHDIFECTMYFLMKTIFMHLNSYLCSQMEELLVAYCVSDMIHGVLKG